MEIDQNDKIKNKLEETTGARPRPIPQFTGLQDYKIAKSRLFVCGNPR